MVPLIGALAAYWFSLPIADQLATAVAPLPLVSAPDPFAPSPYMEGHNESQVRGSIESHGAVVLALRIGAGCLAYRALK